MFRAKYLTLFRLSFLHTIRNYKALMGHTIFLITCLVIFAHLWKMIAAQIGGINLTASQLLWYIALNEWVLISIPEIQDEMQHDLRSGKLAYLLPRPISYLGATFAEALGTLTANLLTLGLVTFLFTWWQVGGLPFHPAGLPVIIVLGFAASVIAILFQMLIGLSAFWLHDVTPIFWVWEKFLFMLGGLILPLTIYPTWLQTIAAYTPFPAILGGRSALALDFNLHTVMTLVTLLTLWGIIALLSLCFVYRRGLRILNIEGG